VEAKFRVPAVAPATDMHLQEAHFQDLGTADAVQYHNIDISQEDSLKRLADPGQPRISIGHR
jgi:hypothetical protein